MFDTADRDTPGVCRGRRRRAGFTYLELSVAFVLFGLAIGSVGPMVVMQSKQLRQLESRFEGDTTYYVVPIEDDWAGKLARRATVETTLPLAAVPPPMPPPPVTLIDNADAGYTEVDLGTVDWHTVTSVTAYQGDFRHQNAYAGGFDSAYWEFTGLPAASYRVLVTWGPATNLATNTPFTVYDSTAVEGTIRVNQTQSPSGPTFNGSPWESLGLLSIASGQLRVEILDDANNYVAADAVRIEEVTNDVQVLSMNKSLTSEQVTATVLVTEPTP